MGTTKLWQCKLKKKLKQLQIGHYYGTTNAIEIKPRKHCKYLNVCCNLLLQTGSEVNSIESIKTAKLHFMCFGPSKHLSVSTVKKLEAE